MNKITYVLTETTVTIDGASLPTYGIACLEGSIQIDHCEDISLDKDLVKRAVSMFNENALSYTHFEAAIEDLVEESSSVVISS